MYVANVNTQTKGPNPVDTCERRSSGNCHEVGKPTAVFGRTFLKNTGIKGGEKTTKTDQKNLCLRMSHCNRYVGEAQHRGSMSQQDGDESPSQHMP